MTACGRKKSRLTQQIEEARGIVEKISKSDPSLEQNDLNYVVLNEANNWTAIVKGVDKYDDLGYQIIYGWYETEITVDGVTIQSTPDFDFPNHKAYSIFTYYLTPDGSISETGDEGYTQVQYTNKDAIIALDSYTNDDGTITFLTGMKNKHNTVKTQVEATKAWDDNEDTYGLRKAITFRLIGEYTVGEKVYEVRNITDMSGRKVSDIEVDGIKDNGLTDSSTVDGEYTPWVATWKNLPRYYDGHEIHYEIAVPEG